MNKRERVMAAIRGEAVDRVPLSFWLHDFTRENSAADLATETIRLYDTFDWDFLKPQSRPYCFSEMWGLRFAPSTDPAVWPEVTHFPVATPEEFAALPVVDASTGALGEQLETFRIIRRHVGDQVPIIATIFAPIMVAGFLLPNGRDDVLRFMNEAPDAFAKGLEAISRTLADYARLCTEEGLDGVFYATTFATRSAMTSEQFSRFQRPYDVPVIEKSAGPFNVIHMCGDAILFEDFMNYPPAVLSWETSPGNPSLSEAQQRSGRAVLGGLPGKPRFGEITVAEVEAETRRAIAETKGRSHLLGPGCSINPGTDASLLHAASRIVRSQS